MTRDLCFGASCPKCGTHFYVRADSVPTDIDPEALISATPRDCVCGKGKFEFQIMPSQEFYTFEQLLGEYEELEE